ncbi:MAG: TonB-dependent receptor domain-containing protein [Myxococcales bacterium]
MLPIVVAILLAQTGENVREVPPPPPAKAPELTRAPQLVEFHAARYPAERLQRGETADVSCLVDIDAAGQVTNVEVVAGAAPDFDDAAVAAIRAFRFSPAEIDGKPAPVRIRYVYHFVLEKRRVEVTAAPDAGRIQGSLAEAGNRRPVAGADVFLDGAQAATSDAQGSFEIAEVPPGRHDLRIAALDFAEDRRTVEVAPRASAELRAYLRRTAVGEFAAVVEGERAKQAATVRTLKHDEFVNVPGSLNDPIRAVQNLPGIARAPFLAGLLLVRGTPPQDTGTYLDGHRIPILYHFLGGPSVINEQLIDRIDFYPGGYGAYYGRNLTSALDVATRKADSTLHGSFSVDFLQAVAFLEGPLGERTQAAIAARRSYIDLFLPLFLPNDRNGSTAVTPVYWDYQARIDHRLLNGDELSFFAIGTDDSLALVQKGRKLAVPIVLDTHTSAHQLRLGWKRTLSSDFSLSVSPLAGIITTSVDSTGLGQGTFRNQQSGKLLDYQLALRAEGRYRASSTVSVRGGMDGAWDRYRVGADIESGLQLRGLGFTVTQPLHIEHARVLASLGEYVETDARIGRFQLVPGLRFDQFHWQDHTYAVVDPRLWVRYSATEATAIKAYAGIYHQAPNPANIDPSIGNPDLGPQRSWQAGLGVEHHFDPTWNLSVEGFYLRRSSLVSRVPATSVDGAVVENPLYQNVGIGRSYGVEVLLRHEFTGRLYGWIAYTLSRSDLIARPDDNGWSAFNFDQPHNLIVVAGYRPTPSWELSTRFRLVSGNPMAPVDRATFDADSGRFIPDSGTFGAARLPAFSQLDARAQYSFVHDLWRLAVYLDVQNVLNHRNQELHVWDYRYRNDGYIGGLPILPTFGVKASF